MRSRPFHVLPTEPDREEVLWYLVAGVVLLAGFLGAAATIVYALTAGRPFREVVALIVVCVILGVAGVGVLSWVARHSR